MRVDLLARLLADLAARGVDLRVAGDRLRYRPLAALDGQLRGRLVELRTDLLELAALTAVGGDSELAGVRPDTDDTAASLTLRWIERYEERAAIHQYEGKLPRVEAEARAWHSTVEALREHLGGLACAAPATGDSVTHGSAAEEAHA